jgi:cytochrome b pre-mRNA-processing protein 3
LLTAEARQPDWYVEGVVPDTMDGRFAVLATLTALAMVRLEREGEDGNRSSVALTERFIEVMESEHRELGLGDPTLGRQVRKLVGSLSRRVELWRAAANGERDWNEAARESLYKDEVSPDALMHSATALREFWSKLGGVGVDALVNGRLG